MADRCRCVRNGGGRRGEVWAGNVALATRANRMFRRVLYTGPHLQLVTMSIPPGTDIGLERHSDVDQFFRIEGGRGVLSYGASRSRHRLLTRPVANDDAFLVPAGTWHNVTATGRQPLQLYTLYAPPEHPPGTVQLTKPTRSKK